MTVATVRALTADDAGCLDGVRRLLEQLSPSGATLSATDLAAAAASGVSDVLAAWEDERVVGVVSVVVASSLTSRFALLEDLVVDVTRRKRGIGAMLVQAVLDHAAARGAKAVYLTSRPHREAANEMYVALGFERQETNYYRYLL